MQFRTDLAIEAATQGDKAIPGIKQESRQVEDIRLTRIVIENEQGEQALGRPRGTYITAELQPLSDDEENMEGKAKILGDELRSLLPESGVVLVTGLGNQSVTPDALGPRSAGMVLATRHIEGEFARSTGLDKLRANSPSVERLGCTVQICDTGIAPGSGVGNNRMALNKEKLGVPVIGLGVPTVVDARTVAMELTGREEAGNQVTPRGAEMMVTPREIDLIIKRASQLVAMTINAALQPDYSPLSLVSAAG